MDSIHLEQEGGMVSGITLAELAPGAQAFGEAVTIYCATWPNDAQDMQAVNAFFTRYAGMPDYHGLVARRAGWAVGYGFGVRSEPGNWWHDTVAEQVGADNPALHDAWCLVNLAVAEEERGKGIGALLLSRLLAAQPCPRALLSTEAPNKTARHFYERRGWTTLHKGFAFKEGDQPFTVMRRELGRPEE